MENNPLDNLTPETRQRVEGVLGALWGGTFSGMNSAFVGQFTNVPQKHNQAWAHWEYDPYEWALFDSVDWLPARNKSRLTLIIGPIVCLLLIGVPLAVIWEQIQAEAFLVMLVPAILLLVALLILIIFTSISAREAKKRYQARQNLAEPHKVTATLRRSTCLFLAAMRQKPSASGNAITKR